MNVRRVVLVGLVVPSFLGLVGMQKTPGEGAPTFKANVMPIFEKYCLPCHAEESFNPSALSLDDHALLMKGGEHGAAVVPGKPEESLLVKKVRADPPFGERMPMRPKRRKSVDRPVQLSEEDVRVLQEWIKAGAKND
ncbi:hypothetical protein PLCT1_00940 [Planctomycetaceae bacterium]|nr:hypothetical protein PLCT1_00940 [Planctomycetaceae bacterium]